MIILMARKESSYEVTYIIIALSYTCCITKRLQVLKLNCTMCLSLVWLCKVDGYIYNYYDGIIIMISYKNALKLGSDLYIAAELNDRAYIGM